jgi:hypothetical protein
MMHLRDMFHRKVQLCNVSVYLGEAHRYQWMMCLANMRAQSTLSEICSGRSYLFLLFRAHNHRCCFPKHITPDC